METESAELCGIPGEHHEPVTKEEFNRLLVQIKYYHLRPHMKETKDLKELVVRTHELLESHIKADAEWFNKLAGAKWALWVIAGCLVPAVPFMVYMIRALIIAKVI